MNAEQSQILIEQLGGNRFIAMTGSKNFMRNEPTEAVPESFLRMDLTKNRGKVNRLKITLNANDTYTMYFYKLTFKNYEGIVSNEITKANVYEDMLQSIFTEITGLDTHL